MRERCDFVGPSSLMSDDFTETKQSSKLVYSGKMLQVHEDQVGLPDGTTARREYVTHPGAALILPWFDDDSILLERQYRYPVGMHCYELPAGKFEPGEPPLQTAQRELLEETGYVADEWKLLYSTLPCVGYSNERIEFFLARELSFKGASLDEGEFLETLRLPLAEALEWIRNGTINDTKTMLGLLWADRMLNAGW
jgi:ADP-ribose pyrophosphatase